MRKTDSKKLETRDFISVGIFSLIYAVVAFVIGGVAQMTPVTFPFMPMIVALFTGTVFMLYVAKIPKKGALSILGVIAAILLFTVPPATPIVKGIYVFITYNFCTTVVYTALNLPYATLATLMTRDTDQRAVVNLFRTGMSALGNMVITAVTFPLVTRLGATQQAWIEVSILYAIVSIILLFILSDMAEQERRRIGILRALGASETAIWRTHRLLAKREGL